MNDSIKRILWAITELEASSFHLQATLEAERAKLREIMLQEHCAGKGEQYDVPQA